MLLLTITLAHMLLTVPARVSQHHTIPHSRNLAAICPRDATPKKKRDFLGIFPKEGGGGSSQFPKLFKINQVIFGMPKSFLGAKTCFTIVGW